MEQWKAVVGFENFYQVSSLGNVRSLDRVVFHPQGQIKRKGVNLKPSSSYKGYRKVLLHKEGLIKTVKVSRLVAAAFVSKKKGSDIVDHIDRDRGNDAAANLRWATAKENSSNLSPRKPKICPHCGKTP